MAAKAKSDFKVDLSDLCKIPAKELEKHFRDWMERDDVARALQAKLRADLIANFNKTTLGKQILSQTTTIASASTTQRLTLSPLILALNTLVAEFLYAQNCHFSLSVFCTEVPFRNTLPDFESMRFFRFSEVEVSEIILAISGSDKYKAMDSEISKKYVESGNVSLLFFILKSLLDRVTGTTTPVPATSTPLSPKVKTSQNANVKPDFETNVYNKNFRYLNKYLIVLSRKVTEMAERFKSLQLQREADQTPTMRPRVFKSVKIRKYENLNRSLERITENLKQMTHARRKNKHLGAILAAINGLGTQFAKCATNFDNMQTSVTTRCSMQDIEVRQKPQTASIGIEKQTETEVFEKTYSDWVREMRNTQNGQKFLDRVEIALRKALSKQKEELLMESEMKLRHQKELLKIRFKQKLMERSSTDRAKDVSRETEKADDIIKDQLKLLEAKNLELMHKLQEANKTTNEEAPITKFLQTPECQNVKSVNPTLQPQLKRPLTEDVLYTQRQLQEMIRGMTEQERTVDHIVYDAKLRIQELENESNQLEKNFLNYLERQRVQKDDTHDTAKKLWEYYKKDRNKMQEKYFHVKQKPNQRCGESFCKKKEQRDDCVQAKTKPLELKSNTNSIQSLSDPNTLKFQNAIREAKEKFFEDEQWVKVRVERENKNKDSLFNLDEEIVYDQKDNETKLVVKAAISEIVIKDVLLNQEIGCNVTSENQTPITALPHLPVKTVNNNLKCKHTIPGEALYENKDGLKTDSSRSSRDTEYFQEQPNKCNITTRQRKQIKQHIYTISPTVSAEIFIDRGVGEYEVDTVKHKDIKSASTTMLLQHSMSKMQDLFAQTQYSETSAGDEANEEINLELCIGSESETSGDTDAGSDKVDDDKDDGNNKNNCSPNSQLGEQQNQKTAPWDDPGISSCDSDSERTSADMEYCPEKKSTVRELESEERVRTVEENGGKLSGVVHVSASSSTSNSSNQLQMSVGGGRNSDSSIDVW